MSETRKITKKSIILLSITILLVVSLSIFIPLMYCAAIGCGPANSESGYTDITTEQAYNMILDKETYPELIILDVRTPSEYYTGHVNNSINISVDELQSRILEIISYNETEIIVYCRTGARSRTASGILVANNFTLVYNMLGGISGWINSGYTVF